MYEYIEELLGHSGNAMIGRRELLKGAALGAVALGMPAAAMARSLNGTAVNHVSYQAVDYKKTRDFYVDVLGFQPSEEQNNQIYLWAGDTLISAKSTPAATTPVIDHIGITVEPWDPKGIEAALKERGVTVRGTDPTAKSLFAPDPHAYNVQFCAKDLEVKPKAAASRAPLKAVGINHISYQCADYKKARDFYKDIFGVPVTKDDGKQAYLWFGDAFMVVRNSPNAGPKPLIDHLAWTIADWDKNRIDAELKKRGLDSRPDAEGLSIITKDVNGYSVQLCSKDLEKRPA